MIATAEQRSYGPEGWTIYRRWRRWQTIWRSVNVCLGAASTGLAAIVATNGIAFSVLGSATPWLAAAVPVLTFLLTTLRPQGNAAAYETAARELEKALRTYDADPSHDDAFLADAIRRGLDILNRVGGS